MRDNCAPRRTGIVRYHLRAVPGVAEVASVGGFEPQYQVMVDPLKLRARGVSMAQVVEAVKRATARRAAGCSNCRRRIHDSGPRIPPVRSRPGKCSGGRGGRERGSTRARRGRSRAGTRDAPRCRGLERRGRARVRNRRDARGRQCAGRDPRRKGEAARNRARAARGSDRSKTVYDRSVFIQSALRACGIRCSKSCSRWRW